MTDAERAELNRARERDWNEWADARIAAALAEHDRIHTEATGQALAHGSAANWRDEFAKTFLGDPYFAGSFTRG
jgi:hypothetical protein